MGLFDGLLGQLGTHVDIDNLAAKIGLNPDQVEQAIAALAQAHGQPNDTVASASQATGIGTDKLEQIVEAIGGEGSLGRFAQLLGEGGGEGLLGKIGGMFGKN